MMTNRTNKWNRWFDSIYREVTNICVGRKIFSEIQDMVRGNPKIQKASSFYDFLGNAYVALQLMAVRRQIKMDKHSISFARLLKEISEMPQALSRDEFIVPRDDGRQGQLAERGSERFADKEEGKEDQIDPKSVDLDLQELRAKAKKCERYADRRIAHLDSRRPRSIPTFADLDECIDFLEALVKKYHPLFRGGSLLSVLPEWQYDWKAIFKERWLAD